MKQPRIYNLKYTYIQNQVDSGVLDVYIDGDIVDAPTQEIYEKWFGDETSTSFKSFRDTITTSSAKTVHIHINSGGGMVADALAMHDFIKEGIDNGKDWHTHGKGMVASAATYPLLAPLTSKKPDNMHISENCFHMIHNVSGGAYGSVDEVEAGARQMRKFNDTARDLYAEKFNKPKETISAWMNAETWWTGKDMVKLGLINAKNCGPAENIITNSIPKEKWPFQNMAILNTINSSIQPPSKNKEMKIKKIGNTIADAIKNALTEAGVIKDNKVGTVDLAAFQTSITNGINTALDSLETEMSTEITNGIAEGLKGDAFNTAVANALAAITKVPEPITNAITTATKDLVNQTALDKVVKDITDKLGTTNTKKLKNSTVETEPEGVSELDGWNR